MLTPRGARRGPGAGAALGVLVLVLASVGGARARAQAPTGDAHALTTAQVLRLADERAPDVSVAEAQASVAQSEVGVAGILPTPRIGGGVSVDYAGILDLFVQLPIFGQLDTATDAARARAQLASASIDVARLDARLAAVLAWTDLWLAERLATLASDEAARRERLEEIATAREAEGTASHLDVIRASADAARARAEDEAQARVVRAAAARLAGAIGEAPGERALTTGGDPLTGGDPESETEAAARLEAHPLVARADDGVEAADAAAVHEHRSRWPRLGIQVSDWIHRANDAHDVRVMLTMDLALFDEPRIGRADAVRAQARVEADAVRTRLRAGIASAREDLAATQSRCAAQEAEVLPRAREAADLARAGYEEGSVDLTTTLAAAQALADAERALAGCWADRARAAARHAHAEGRTDDWP
ncbi:MAG: TolC family protein [Sandaracinus sp.]